MKPRQFAQIASKRPAERWQLLADGLQLLAASIEQLLEEIAQANTAGAYRAGHLACNVAREEAGKFLVLIDVARDRGSQKQMHSQLRRASSHPEKLMYAQMADYSIGDSNEMRRAIAAHRDRYYLDGPNDFDWIFPNDLITRRESAMYVDLVEYEGGDLDWNTPPSPTRDHPRRSTHLVVAIWRAGLTTLDGLFALGEAWKDFDYEENTTAAEWTSRTNNAVAHLPNSIASDRDSAAFAAWWWPMPITRFDITMNEVKLEDVKARREAEFEEWLAREYGDPSSM